MKRSFLFILVFALVAGVSLSAQSAPAYRDGTYKLDYQDAELGSVTVSVVVKDGKIAAVNLPAGKGDVGMDDASLDQWLKTFLAAPDFMTVDVVSGATQSCDLIRYAVQNALKPALQKQ